MPRRKRRRPPQLSLFQRGWSAIKRNPVKAITAAVVIFGGLPSAVAGANYLDPIVPAFHYYVLEKLAPILLVQNTQARSIDRFLLYSQQRDLAAVQSDSAAKTSPVVRDRIKELQEQIQETEARIKSGSKP